MRLDRSATCAGVGRRPLVAAADVRETPLELVLRHEQVAPCRRASPRGRRSRSRPRGSSRSPPRGRPPRRGRRTCSATCRCRTPRGSARCASVGLAGYDRDAVDRARELAEPARDAALLAVVELHEHRHAAERGRPAAAAPRGTAPSKIVGLPRRKPQRLRKKCRAVTARPRRISERTERIHRARPRTAPTVTTPAATSCLGRRDAGAPERIPGDVAVARHACARSPAAPPPDRTGRAAISIPSRRPSARKISPSLSCSPGSSARQIRCTRPAWLVKVPSFSANVRPGSTTSASASSGCSFDVTTTSVSRRAKTSAHRPPQRSQTSVPVTSRPRIVPASMPARIPTRSSSPAAAASPRSRAPRPFAAFSALIRKSSAGPSRMATSRCGGAQTAGDQASEHEQLLVGEVRRDDRRERGAAVVTGQRPEPSRRLVERVLHRRRMRRRRRGRTVGTRRRVARSRSGSCSRPWSHIQVSFTASLRRGRKR